MILEFILVQSCSSVKNKNKIKQKKNPSILFIVRIFHTVPVIFCRIPKLQNFSKLVCTDKMFLLINRLQDRVQPGLVTGLQSSSCCRSVIRYEWSD